MGIMRVILPRETALVLLKDAQRELRMPSDQAAVIIERYLGIRQGESPMPNQHPITITVDDHELEALASESRRTGTPIHQLALDQFRHGPGRPRGTSDRDADQRDATPAGPGTRPIATPTAAERAAEEHRAQYDTTTDRQPEPQGQQPAQAPVEPVAPATTAAPEPLNEPAPAEPAPRQDTEPAPHSQEAQARGPGATAPRPLNRPAGATRPAGAMRPADKKK